MSEFDVGDSTAQTLNRAELTKQPSRSEGILVIDATIPEYDKHAGARNSFAYLRLLAKMGFRVCFMPNDLLRREPYASELEAMGIQLLTGPRFGCGVWHDWLVKQGSQISHILIHRPNVAQRHLADLRRLSKAKLVYFAHDLRHLREARHFQLSPDAYHRQEAEYWLTQEKRILSLVDVAYFVSDHEVSVCQTWGQAKLRRVPMFPDMSCITPPSASASAETERMLFVGNFAHAPNVDAMLWFCKEIMPLIRSRVPKARLHVVGNGAPDAVLALGKLPGIQLEGRVDDASLSRLYSEVGMVVAPLRFGAGVKGKVVEALAYGLPVVTTPTGAEGIPDCDDVLLIGESAQALADSIVALCCDSNLWTNTRQAVATYAKSHFSVDEALAILEQDFGQCTEKSTVAT